jgi:hypothetical protein
VKLSRSAAEFRFYRQTLRGFASGAFADRPALHLSGRGKAEARKLLSLRNSGSGSSRGLFSGSQSSIPEVAMSIFSYRKHLRFLTHSQRRRWWDQKKRLTPRVKISGAYVPPNVTREFTYVKVG